MTLSTGHVVGDLGHTTDHNAIATAINANSAAVAALFAEIPEVGTTTGTVAAGDDARIVGAVQKTANLSDVASASTARTNLGLGDAATHAAADFDAAGAASAAKAAAGAIVLADGSWGIRPAGYASVEWVDAAGTAGDPADSQTVEDGDHWVHPA